MQRLSGPDARRPEEEEGRAWGSSLFLLGAFLPALAASLLNNAVYWCATVVLLYLAGPWRTASRLPANALTVGMVLMCAWLFADAALRTPHYAPAAIYRPLVLLGAFWASSLLPAAAMIRVFRAGVVLVALLVLIGMLQTWTGFHHIAAHGDRAAATFSTPNTFATVINLLLLPLVALSVTGRGGRAAFILSLWLFEGLLITGSRGGWVAFAAGIAFLLWYMGLPRGRAEGRPWLRIGLGFACVYVLHTLVKSLVGGVDLVDMIMADTLARGASFRMEIFSVTLERIAEQPLAGYGANMFSPLFEMTKPASLDRPMSFPFAHNDYLQIWLEFGALGILGLLFVVAAALRALLRARATKEHGPALACGGAIAAFLVHALVDFPLYVAIPELLFGAALGALSRRRGDDARIVGALARFPSPSMFFKRALGVAALAWVAQPAVAEIASHRAVAELMNLRPSEALYWQSVARRFEPHYGHRYWEEGVIWRDQAIETGNRALAATADATFAAGMLAAPYDPSNFYERARLHRQHPDLLPGAVSKEQILEWSAQALRLLPLSISTRVEYAHSLAHAGRLQEARKLSRELVRKRPESENARRLAKELGA